MSAISEAEKLSGYCAQELPQVADNCAISIRATWDSVTQIAHINVPLRRPSRSAPTNAQEDDAEAAATALLMPSDEDVSYDVFRKGLGL